MKRLGIIAIQLLLLQTVVSCKSQDKKKPTVQYVYNKPLPKSEVSRAVSGDILVSSTRLDRVGSRNKIVYVYWRFMSGQAPNTINLQYEEHYQRIKDKPDLVDKKSMKVADTLTIDTYTLNIYQLKPKTLIYQISSQGGE